MARANSNGPEAVSMMSGDIWQLETAFWTANREEDQRALDPPLLDVVPAASGHHCRRSKHHEHERSTALADRGHGRKVSAQPTVDPVVLAYFVSARRDSDGTYTAYCTSTYRQSASGWKLFQHQQAPT